MWLHDSRSETLNDKCNKYLFRCAESCIIHYIGIYAQRIPSTAILYMCYSATYPHQIKRYRSIQIRSACSMWHCAAPLAGWAGAGGGGAAPGGACGGGPWAAAMGSGHGRRRCWRGVRGCWGGWCWTEAVRQRRDRTVAERATGETHWITQIR